MVQKKFNLLLCIIGFFCISLAASTIPVSSSNTNYYINIGDVLKIEIWKHPELKRIVTVDQEGNIEYDVLGKKYYVRNFTSSEVEESLIKDVKKIIFPAALSVSVVEYASLNVEVFGDIKTPGNYKISRDKNLLSLMNVVGWTYHPAKITEIKVFRKNKLNILININDYFEKNHIGNNIKLIDKDVIYVKVYEKLNKGLSNDNKNLIRTNEKISKVIELKYAYAKDVLPILENFVSENGKISISENLNTIVVNDSVKNMNDIYSIIKSLDKPEVVPQFEIEAQILEITLTDDKTFGVRVEELETDDNDGGGGATTTNKNVILFGIDGALQLKNYNSNFTVLLESIRKKGNLRTLSSPKIVTSNNQKASISVGDQIPYKKAESLNENTVTTYEFKDVFISLDVVPRLLKPDMIELTITPEVSFLTGYSQDNQPIINTRKATTNVIIKNKETIFIGGIINNVNTKNKRTVPLFKHVPLLKELFTRKVSGDKKTELLVLITCKTFNNSEKYLKKRDALIKDNFLKANILGK